MLVRRNAQEIEERRVMTEKNEPMICVECSAAIPLGGPRYAWNDLSICICCVETACANGQSPGIYLASLGRRLGNENAEEELRDCCRPNCPQHQAATGGDK